MADMIYLLHKDHLRSPVAQAQQVADRFIDLPIKMYWLDIYGKNSQERISCKYVQQFVASLKSLSQK
jgi:hypothetical protein